MGNIIDKCCTGGNLLNNSTHLYNYNSRSLSLNSQMPVPMD